MSGSTCVTASTMSHWHNRPDVDRFWVSQPTACISRINCYGTGQSMQKISNTGKIYRTAARNFHKNYLFHQKTYTKRNLVNKRCSVPNLTTLPKSPIYLQFFGVITYLTVYLSWSRFQHLSAEHHNHHSCQFFLRCTSFLAHDLHSHNRYFAKDSDETYAGEINVAVVVRKVTELCKCFEEQLPNMTMHMTRERREQPKSITVMWIITSCNYAFCTLCQANATE